MDRAVETQEFIRCNVFLNGEYWGIYWLNEKYDARYLDYYYGVSKDNVIIIKEGGKRQIISVL